MQAHYDIIVIGAGIAGASVAAYLAESQRVLMLERESFPGYHSTGRSAALFSEIYGNETVRKLSTGSRKFLFDAPPGFAEVPLVGPRGVLFVGRKDQEAAIESFSREPGIASATEHVEAGQACALVPLLRPEYVAAALFEPGASDIDVNALHTGFLRMFKASGGQLFVNAQVTGVANDAGNWLSVCRKTPRPDDFITAMVLIVFFLRVA